MSTSDNLFPNYLPRYTAFIRCCALLAAARPQAGSQLHGVRVVSQQLSPGNTSQGAVFGVGSGSASQPAVRTFTLGDGVVLTRVVLAVAELEVESRRLHLCGKWRRSGRHISGRWYFSGWFSSGRH